MTTPINTANTIPASLKAATNAIGAKVIAQTIIQYVATPMSPTTVAFFHTRLAWGNAVLPRFQATNVTNGIVSKAHTHAM